MIKSIVFSFTISLYSVAISLAFAVIQTNKARALPVFDNEFECTIKQKADQYVNDFKINARSFGGIELCNHQIDTKKLFNDLALVEEGRFSAASSNLLIGNFVPVNKYYLWLKEQTLGMNRANDYPWATAYNSNGYFTMQDGWAQLSSLGRVGVVLHEARHTEGYRHIPCNFGPYAGADLDACDSEFNYGGSHAVEMEYYARVVVFGENFHPLYKKMARLMAMGRSNFVFNKKIIKPREALFLIRKDRPEGLLIDGNNLYLREIAGTGILKRTSFGPTLYTPQIAFSLDPYEWIGDTRPTEDSYSYFKLLTLKNGIPSGQLPMDLEEYDSGNKRFLAAIDQKNQFGLYNFKEGGWGKFKSVSTRPALGFKTQYQDRHGLFLVLSDYKLLQFQPTNSTFVETKFVWDSAQISFMESPQGEVLQLLSDGVVRTIDGRVWEATQKALWSQAVNIPLYDAFSVH